MHLKADTLLAILKPTAPKKWAGKKYQFFICHDFEEFKYLIQN